MPTSDKQIAANRLNALKSRGPTNTTSTRFNASKHGLLAIGITELDDAEGYRTMRRDLIKEINPIGMMEMYLVAAAAVERVRSLRPRRLEGEYTPVILKPPIYSLYRETSTPMDPGLPAPMKL